MKKSLRIGSKYQIIEHAFKPQYNLSLRTVEKIQTNAIQGDGVWLLWQKARNTRFNQDGTIDFLLGEEMKDEWLIEQQAKDNNKDYWLKVKFLL